MKYLLLLFSISCFCQGIRPEVAQAVRGSIALRNTMRDPDSFIIGKVLTLTDKQGDYVTCFEYRARNGYGGMNRGAAHYTEHKGKPHVDGVNYDWCAVTKYKPFVDITTEFKDATTH